MQPAAQLNALADYVNNGNNCSGLSFELTGNIGEIGEFTPIGDADTAFNGIFYGKCYELSGLAIDIGNNGYAGLFGSTGTDASIWNLSVSGSVKGKDYVGGIVGANFGMIFDCTNSCSVTGTDGFIGGVVGCNEGSVDTCRNTGAVTVNGECDYIGGVVGCNEGSVDTCRNTGAVTVNGECDYIGGVVGSNDNHASVRESYNTGDVTVTGYGNSNIGGVVGRNNNDITIENCYNTGAITVTGGYNWDIGGVVGWNDSAPVKNCYNTGYISVCKGDEECAGNQNIGGVVGSTSGSIENCCNTGAVAVGGVGSIFTGGIVGLCDGSILYSFNTGTVTGIGNVGGISGNGSAEYCYNKGAVTGNTHVGGISGTDSVKNSFNTGAVTGIDHIGNINYNDKYTNCFYLNGAETDDDGRTAEQFASGEVCFLLNGGEFGEPVFRQNIDNDETADALPVLDSTHGAVYITSKCNAADTYGNTANAERHCYENGFCTQKEGEVHLQPAEYVPETDTDAAYYAISNAGQLIWFAETVNRGALGTQNASSPQTSTLRSRLCSKIRLMCR